MSKKLLKVSLLSLLVLPVLNACNQKEYASDVDKFEKKENIPTFLFNPTEPNYCVDLAEYAMEGEVTGTTYVFINDSTIPYYSLTDYVNDYLEPYSELGFVHFSIEYVDRTAKIKNEKTQSIISINFRSGDVSFSSHAGFFTTSEDAGIIGDFSGASGDDVFFGEKRFIYKSGNKKVSYNLKDYNIKGYWYENEGYLPYEFLNIMLTTINRLGFYGSYYNGENVYLLSGDNSDEWQGYVDYIRKNDTALNKEYMQYNYDCLAFIVDSHFGLDKRLLRTENKYKDYKKKSAYSLLKPYKNRLLSTEENVYEKAIVEFFENELDDGGHTRYNPYSLLKTDKNISFSGGKDTINTGLCIEKLQEARSLTPYKPIEDELNTSNSDYCEIEDTAFITFDEFTNYWDYDFSYDNYFENTLYLFQYANEQIRAHDIKNVVIDLSCNGGGLLYVEQYIESWACGGSFISYECDMIDGSLITVSKHADVNHDGMITSEDYLSSDINLYCIISPGSFSCGNLLPYRLKERTNCKFIGDRSGGGACTLENYRYLPVGGNCRLSSFVGTATLDSTVENMKSIEDGVEADFYKIPCTEENYAKYFDRPAIVEKIHNAGK